MDHFRTLEKCWICSSRTISRLHFVSRPPYSDRHWQLINFPRTVLTGNNLGKGRIDDTTQPWPALISRMAAEGHQIASHTWSHQDLSAITKEQRYEQMVKLEMAVTNIIGKFPTYMRPPYSSCSDASGCPQDMADLGYHVSYFDLDTDGTSQHLAG